MKRVAFNGGEISPELSLRSDLDVFQRAAQSLVNFDVSQMGGIRRRRGMMAFCPTRGQINEFVLERSANTENWHESASCPNTWLKRPALPGGWYRVEVMLNSANGDDALGIINAAAVRSRQVKCVTGLAYGGTDNSSCPYTSWDGVEWYNNSSEAVSRAMASVVRLDFIYCHYEATDVAWLGEGLVSAWTGWNKGVARYTGIRPPQELS